MGYCLDPRERNSLQIPESGEAAPSTVARVRIERETIEHPLLFRSTAQVRAERKLNGTSADRDRAALPLPVQGEIERKDDNVAYYTWRAPCFDGGEGRGAFNWRIATPSTPRSL